MCVYVCVCVYIYIYTYLHATSISPSHPLVEPRPPIFDEVLFGVLDPVPVPEPALGPGRRQYTRAVQIHLEVLLSFLRDHIFRAPGTAALVLSQPGELRAELLRPLKREYSRATAYSIRLYVGIRGYSPAYEKAENIFYRISFDKYMYIYTYKTLFLFVPMNKKYTFCRERDIKVEEDFKF